MKKSLIKSPVRALGRAALFAALLAVPVQMQGVKAWPGLLKGKLAGGAEVEYTLQGDEFGHAYVSTAGKMLMQTETGLVEGGVFSLDSLAAARMKKAPAKRVLSLDFPTKGNLKGLIILVEFSDNSFVEGHDSDLFSARMNEAGYSEGGATGSARDYFVDQSDGLFTPDFDVVGPVKLPRAMLYYGANDRYGQDSNPAQMVKDACELADEKFDVDFSKYDYDQDGTVDFVYLIYAGYAESYGASSNTIWPHASQLSLHYTDCVLDGKKIDRYACSSELKYVSGETVEGIGTFCHEFGHVLGLPDMYDTRTASNFQLGAWDVMDQGSYNNESRTPPGYSAFERASLGWMELTEIDTPSERMELPELSSSKVAYKITTPTENEYFTLENRQQKGWDLHQPGKGLMIIHVAYDEGAWTNNYVNSGIINRYDLVEADGLKGAGSYEGDLFPYGEKDSFTDYTFPSSLAWNGEQTGKGVSKIRDEEGLITFRFMLDRLAMPENLVVTATGEDWADLSWDAVEHAGPYKVNVREILTEEENPVVLSEDFEAFENGNYPNAYLEELAGNMDEYTSMPGWGGEEIFACGGCVRLGKYGVSGLLRTPILTRPEVCDSVTVAIKGASYPGKSVNINVRILDGVTGDVLKEVTDKATKTWKDYVVTVGDLPKYFRVEVSSNKERLFISDMRVLRDHPAEEEFWTCGPRNWSVEGIEETSYRVDGLLPLHTYFFSVQAMPFNDMHGSEPTEEIEGRTLVSGVDTVEGDGAVTGIRRYDLFGREIKEGTEGVSIVVTTFSDGSRKVVKTIGL